MPTVSIDNNNENIFEAVVRSIKSELEDLKN